jgi:hypothetical protein
MSDEKRKPIHPARSSESQRDVRGHPETNFLPPLKMVLAFLDRNSQPVEKDAETQEDSDERKIEKLIEKLSEKDE